MPYLVETLLLQRPGTLAPTNSCTATALLLHLCPASIITAAAKSNTAPPLLPQGCVASIRLVHHITPNNVTTPSVYPGSGCSAFRRFTPSVVHHNSKSRRSRTINFFAYLLNPPSLVREARLRPTTFPYVGKALCITIPTGCSVLRVFLFFLVQPASHTVAAYLPTLLPRDSLCLCCYTTPCRRRPGTESVSQTQ